MTLPPRSTLLTTPRLLLRPSHAGDGQRAFEIRSDPAVSKMLSLARFPPALDETADWFADHAREWAEGLAFRFAIERQDRMIGLVDLDDVSVDGQEAEIGVWLEQRAGAVAMPPRRRAPSSTGRSALWDSLASGRATPRTTPGRPAWWRPSDSGTSAPMVTMVSSTGRTRASRRFSATHA
jgi:RimJ/RimL family protein N-acetyltransferase